jgi:cold shock CspA family protein
MSADTIETTTLGTSTLIGRVKWFNNKAGYGFITVMSGPTSGTDIFTHHTSITVSNEQYKYLVQGEYVQFTQTATDGGVHSIQAGKVAGINGGKLMCETRNEFKQTRSENQPELEGESSPRGPREGQSWSMTNRGRGGRGAGRGRGNSGGRNNRQTPAATFDV